MSWLSLLLLAIGLAMDATAVAAARGLSLPKVRLGHVLRVALFFGGAQGLMPLLGWLIGDRVGPWVQAWAPWIAFVLLAGLGGKTLWEAYRHDDEDDDEPQGEDNQFGFKTMLLLAIATSIDALAVGFTLPMLGAPLLLSLLTIGVVTAGLSVAGLLLGRRFGALLGKRLDLLGGLVLLALGVKILLEHLLSR